MREICDVNKYVQIIIVFFTNNYYIKKIFINKLYEVNTKY